MHHAPHQLASCGLQYVGPNLRELFSFPQLLTFIVCLILILAAAFDLLRCCFSIMLSKRPKFSTTVLVLYLAAVGITFGSLNCGYLAFPPAPRRVSTKIFGIGLSRTGTTSLTVALNAANISSYHALPHLLEWSEDLTKPPRVNKLWADAYEGHTDIQSSIVFKELAELYPRAKFVYNRRPADEWGKSMLRFMETHAELWNTLQNAHNFGVPVPPVDRLFRSMYGDWPHHSAADWTAQYHKYDLEVREFFESTNRSSQLLNISFTQGEGWVVRSQSREFLYELT